MRFHFCFKQNELTVTLVFLDYDSFSTPPPPYRRFRRHARQLGGVGTASVAVNSELPRRKDVEEEKVRGKRDAAARGKEEESELLQPLYDDGFGGVNVRDYFAAARAVVSREYVDGGPPRWFCPVESGPPAVDRAPLLLFLPGTDGTGMGLILHHKSLGKAFEVRCLHIPVNDRTPFEGLLQIIQQSVKHEHDLSPNRPIYLVGDSLGGCLALAVAARHPQIDLVLLLINPATSFARSPWQKLLPFLEAMPSELHVIVPHLLSFMMGDPLMMAMVSVDNNLSPLETLQKLSDSLTSMLPLFSELADILPRDTLLWKLELVKSGAAYANSYLHAVEAEVLLLASGNDKVVPSGEEADRLFKTLKKCRVRYFKANGHALLLEEGVNLLSIIKGTNLYRRGKQHDFVSDHLPPTLHEFRTTFDDHHRLAHLAVSPVMMSTLKSGEVVRGLAGVPVPEQHNQGPVLLVGYHALMGMELSPLYEGFLREKRTLIRVLAHPVIFGRYLEDSSRREPPRFDLRMLGASPVNPLNMYRLFEARQCVLLYPGGVREANHRKDEEYKLFWPDEPEFVRMASRFGATIVPFGFVGEDDVSKVVLDYNEQQKIPFLRKRIQSFNKDIPRMRDTVQGEDGNQDMHLPFYVPKVPGRFYYLFGKPIETKGMIQGVVGSDRKIVNQVYLQIKSEVENMISYLKRKREQDPYRSIVRRALYQSTWGVSASVPTFEP